MFESKLLNPTALMKRHTEKAALIFLSILMLVMPWVFLMALQTPLSFGLWSRSEPTMVLMFGSFALAALALLLLSASQSALVRQAVSHPISLIPILIGLWSLLVAPFQPIPWLTVFGITETGTGAYCKSCKTAS